MRPTAWILSVCLALAVTARATAAVTLPAIFSDHMVLQKSDQVPVWGWAEPGESVSVRVAGASAQARAGSDRRWQVVLDLGSASPGPHQAVVQGQNRLEINDVLIGEVWLGSGQSNMSYGLGGSVNGPADAAQADFPELRFFQIAVDPSLTPAADCRARWVLCTPQTAGPFSAIGFYFGRRLHQELKVPVGMIQAAEGGTGAESWISRQGLSGQAELKPIQDQLESICARAKTWDPSARHEELKYNDGWVTVPDDDWLDMELPQTWQNAGYNINGQIFFRRSVTIPEHWVGKELTLSLGPLKRFDQTKVNGVMVGTTEGAGLFRKYAIPAAVVGSVQLSLAIRMENSEGFGGFQGAAQDLNLTLANAPEEKPIPLAGPWRFTTLSGNAWIPTSLFNGMIHPIIPFALRGVIWYQGESNGGWFFTPSVPEHWPRSVFHGVHRSRQYRVLFPALIQDWRRQWGRDFSFLFVQLPNQTQARHFPPADQENDWSEIREAQTMALALPHTGMAVTLDLNHEGALHPSNKEQFSQRLEVLALARIYGKPVACDSPLYESMTLEGGQVRLRFRHAAGGLRVQDATAENGSPSLRRFTIAGSDRRWRWAQASIDGECIVVSHPEISAPVAVRYAWPMLGPCAIVNQAGLPLPSFRTDDWANAPAPQ